MSDPFAVVGIKPNGDLPDEVRARMAGNMADPSKPEGAALSSAFASVFTATEEMAVDVVNAWLASPSPLGVKRLLGRVRAFAPIVVPSGTYLDATGATITQHFAGNLVRNARASSTTARDSDITIVGGDWDRGSNAGTGTGLHTMLFRRVDGLNVRDVKVSTAAGKYAISLGDVTRFKLYDIEFDTASDGIHINGPASDGRISHVRGSTHDDMVAITANDFAAYADVVGDVTNIEITDIRASYSAANVVKVLAGAGTLVDDIRVRGVRGQAAQHGVWVGDDAGQANTSGGTYGTIRVSDVLTDSTSGPNTAAVRAKLPNTEALIVTGAAQKSGSTARDVVYVEINANATVQRLELDSLEMKNPGVRNAINIAGSSGSALKRLVINRPRVEAAGGATRLLYITGVAPTQAVLTDPYLVAGDTNVTNWIQNTASSALALYIRGGYVYKGRALLHLSAASQVFIEQGLRVQGPNRLAELYDAAHSITIGDSIIETVLAAIFLNTTAPSANIFGNDRAAFYAGAANALFGRSGTQPVRLSGAELKVDVATLAPQLGDRAYNTNATLPCGVGPVVSNGTVWKNLYTGATT